MLIGDLSNVEIFDFGQQKLPKKAGNDQLSTSIVGEYAYKFPSQCKTLLLGLPWYCPNKFEVLGENSKRGFFKIILKKIKIFLNFFFIPI